MPWAARQTSFSDFIYLQATGAEIEGLPVFEYRADDALFFGVDLEASMQVAQWDGGAAKLRVMADFVEAELDVSGNDNIPRIPPLRYGLGVELNSGLITATLDYLHVEDQDDVSPDELTTSDYDDLSVYVGATLPFGETSLNLFVAGKNLTDEEQRSHTSFIKDFAPAPGRTIELGARLLF